MKNLSFVLLTLMIVLLIGCSSEKAGPKEFDLQITTELKENGEHSFSANILEEVVGDISCKWDFGDSSNSGLNHRRIDTVIQVCFPFQ